MGVTLVSSLTDGANKMKPQTLLQKAHTIVTEGHRSAPRYQDLTDSQREQFAAAVMRDLGEYAHEQITNATNIQKIAVAAIEALEEDDVRDRAVLERVIGQLVLEAVQETCEKSVQRELDKAFSELAITRQFPLPVRFPTHPLDSALYNSPNI